MLVHPMCLAFFGQQYCIAGILWPLAQRLNLRDVKPWIGTAHAHACNQL
jgi:hypothetical protein